MLPFGKLLYTIPGRGWAEYLLTQEKVMIGTAVDNDLILDAEGVDDHHARLECRSSGCILADLSSPHGVAVNNKRVRRKRLFTGDMIQIGTVRLRFEAATTEDVSPGNMGEETRLEQEEPSDVGDETTTVIDLASKADTVVDPTAVSGVDSDGKHGRGAYTQIGRYQIKENFGQRGIMLVYRAHDPQLSRDVALKILAPGLHTNPTLLLRIQREIQLIGQLDHPHITQVYDSGLYSDQPYVVMPFFEGGTLASRMKTETLTLKALAPMVNQLTSALDAAHTQGVVHGQITPHNILFDQEQRAYLTDFGVATISEAFNQLHAPLAEQEWASYMSPEQAQDLLNEALFSKLRPATDLFALGVILYEALTGQLPFKGETVRDTAVAILNHPLIPITDLRPELPDSYDLLFEQLLARDPAHRFTSGADLAKHVRETARGRWYMGQLSALLGGAGDHQRDQKREANDDKKDTAVSSTTDVTIAAFTPTLFAPETATPTGLDSNDERKIVPQGTLPAGTRIGRYEISDLLGFGGMASVYLAQDPDVQRGVAIKLLPLKFTFAPEFRQLFAHEARIVAGLRHEAIVSVFDFGEHEDQPFLVMQYLSGGTLNEQLPPNQPLALKRLTPIIDRVAAGLDAAHYKNIIHRDIKPGNIIFNAEDEALLSDFGIAVLSEAGAGTAATEHYAGGTPRYMSPEQATAVLAGEKVQVDGRSDIYGLGVVIFQALTGQVPFDNRSPIEQMKAHIEQPIPKLRDLNSALPSRLQPIINKALAKDPADRHDTASALAQDLREASTGRWYLSQLLD